MGEGSGSHPWGPRHSHENHTGQSCHRQSWAPLSQTSHLEGERGGFRTSHCRTLGSEHTSQDTEIRTYISGHTCLDTLCLSSFGVQQDINNQLSKVLCIEGGQLLSPLVTQGGEGGVYWQERNGALELLSGQPVWCWWWYVCVLCVWGGGERGAGGT